jgi:hypothetical protein
VTRNRPHQRHRLERHFALAAAIRHVDHGDCAGGARAFAEPREPRRIVAQRIDAVGDRPPFAALQRPPEIGEHVDEHQQIGLAIVRRRRPQEVLLQLAATARP